MVEGGLRDILLTYNVIGDAKLDRLAALARKCTLSVTCDNLTVAKGLSARFANEDAELTVLVECDTGAGRCGVQSPADASELASKINELPGLRFGGLMTYPPMDHADNIDKWLSDAKQRLEDAGLSCPVVSTGGTPTWTPCPHLITQLNTAPGPTFTMTGPGLRVAHVVLKTVPRSSRPPWFPARRKPVPSLMPDQRR